MLLLCTLVAAEPLDAWTVEDFGSAGDELVGNDGWEGGYRADPWFVTDYGNAASLTDDVADDDDYGNNGPQDDWIIRGDAIADVVVEAELYAYDDDTVGIVSNHDGDDYYACIYVEDSAPPPVWGVDESTVMILKIADGEAEVLDSGRGQRDDTAFELRMEVDGGVISCDLNGSEEAFASDDDPLGPGQAGLYAYNSGYGEYGYYSGSTWIEVSWLDGDDDGVADDLDNCEDVENEDQEDLDDDGIGDACDDSVEVPEGDDTGDAEADAPTGGLSAGGCGCGAVPVAPFALAVFAVALLRRRR